MINPVNLFGRVAIIVELPFADSSIPSLITGGPATCLNGTLEILLPLTNENQEFSLNIAELGVALRLATDDFDPNDRDEQGNPKSSADKLRQQFVEELSLLIQQEFSQSPPPQLANMLGGGGLGRFAGVPRCPEAETTDQDLGDRVTLQIPTSFLGIDTEIFRAEDLPDGLEPLLLLKGKLTSRAIAKGTSGNRGCVGWISSRTGIGALISEKFLLNEILPAALIPELLSERFEEERSQAIESLRGTITEQVRVDDALTEAVRREVEEAIERDLPNLGADEKALLIRQRLQNALPTAKEEEIRRLLSERLPAELDSRFEAAAAEFFTYPLKVKKENPVPLTLPLPSLDDILDNPEIPQPSSQPTEPNVFIDDISARIAPAEGRDDSILLIVVVMHGSADGYTFKGKTKIEL